MIGKTAVSVNRVLLVIGVATSLSLVSDASLYAVLPTHTAEAGVLLASMGILLSANRFVRLGLNGPIGWLCDRWPRRRLFVSALWLGVLSSATYGWLQGFWPFLVGRLSWGIAWAGIWVAGNAIVMDMARSDNRGRLVGIYNAFFFLGISGGSVLGGWLTDWLGFTASFQVSTYLAGGGALIAWLFLPETAHLQQKDRQSTSNETAIVTKRASLSEIGSAMALLGVHRLVVAGLFSPTLGLYLAYMLGDGIWLNERFVGTATLTGMGLGLSTLLGIIYLPIAGSLSDRWGRWQATAVGLVPGIVGFVMMAFGIPWLIIPALALISITSGSNQGLAIALVGDLARDEQHGRFLGILFTVGDATSAVGPLLAFWLLARVDVPVLYALSAVLFAFIWLVSWWWIRQAQVQLRYDTFSHLSN